MKLEILFLSLLALFVTACLRNLPRKPAGGVCGSHASSLAGGVE